MSELKIPSIFWYAVSFAVVIMSIGFTYIAYRSSSVSVEIANTKISLLSAVTETEALKASLENQYLIQPSAQKPKGAPLEGLVVPNNSNNLSEDLMKKSVEIDKVLEQIKADLTK